MILKVIGTGSSGNCYALYNSKGECLLLDAGLPYQKILEGLNFQISNVVGCLVTHIHADHSKSIKDLASAGVICWRAWMEEQAVTRKFRSFSVTSFEVPHDGTDNRGFLIRTDRQTVLYATDYEYIPVTFKSWKINHMILECNYTPEMLNEDEFKYKHVLRGHASLETAKGVVKANRTGKLRNVVLCHMSAGSDLGRMTKEVSEVAGAAVKVQTAVPGTEIRMDIAPF